MSIRFRYVYNKTCFRMSVLLLRIFGKDVSLQFSYLVSDNGYTPGKFIGSQHHNWLVGSLWIYTFVSDIEILFIFKKPYFSLTKITFLITLFFEKELSYLIFSETWYIYNICALNYRFAKCHEQRNLVSDADCQMYNVS